MTETKHPFLYQTEKTFLINKLCNTTLARSRKLTQENNIMSVWWFLGLVGLSVLPPLLFFSVGSPATGLVVLCN